MLKLVMKISHKRAIFTHQKLPCIDRYKTPVINNGKNEQRDHQQKCRLFAMV